MEWQPIETAPKGGGAEMVTDLGWVEPPTIMVGHPSGAIGVAHWEWYYAEGGDGYRQGINAWVSPETGEPLEWEPTHWMPLPEPPK